MRERKPCTGDGNPIPLPFLRSDTMFQATERPSFSFTPRFILNFMSSLKLGGSQCVSHSRACAPPARSSTDNADRGAWSGAAFAEFDLLLVKDTTLPEKLK